MELLLNSISIAFYKFHKINLQQKWGILARLSNINCPMMLTHSRLGCLLPMFMSRYPAVRVEMIVINRPVDPVEKGMDIVLRVGLLIANSATMVAKNFGVTLAYCRQQ